MPDLYALPVHSGNSMVIQLFTECSKGLISIPSSPTVSIRDVTQTTILGPVPVTTWTVGWSAEQDTVYVFDTTGVPTGYYEAVVAYSYTHSVVGGPVAITKTIGFDIVP